VPATKPTVPKPAIPSTQVSTVAPGLRAMCLDALVERDDEVKKATQAMMLNQQGSLGYIQVGSRRDIKNKAAKVMMLDKQDHRSLIDRGQIWGAAAVLHSATVHIKP
jgi:hypothetical protein